jgi:hypothetical protein
VSRSARLAACILALAAAGSGTLAAQDTTRVVPPADTARPVAPPDSAASARAVRDSAEARRIGRGPGPSGAFFRSLLVPGWGQLALGREMTAGFFIAAEAVLVGIDIDAHRDLRRLRAAASADTVQASRRREDWLVYTAVNHLAAGLEAYVSAHLKDFPADLKVRVGPGLVGGRVTVPFRVR